MRFVRHPRHSSPAFLLRKMIQSKYIDCRLFVYYICLLEKQYVEMSITLPSISWLVDFWITKGPMGAQ